MAVENFYEAWKKDPRGCENYFNPVTNLPRKIQGKKAQKKVDNIP